MKDIARALVYTGVFFLPFIPLIVTNSLFFPFITGKNFAFRIVVEIVFASWILLMLYDEAYRPRFSWILGTLTAFIAVVFIADIFGQDPHASLWSNFERMEGFVTIFHVYLYFLVAASVLTTDKLWRRFWFTSFSAALVMVLYCFAQLGGTIQIRQSTTRLDGLMGNSAYLAMYMLFHVFMAALYLLKAETRGLRIILGVLIALFLFIMIETETRGTALGLVLGTVVASLYVILFGGKEHIRLRRVFAGIMGVVVIAAGAVYLLRDTSLITSHGGLNRIAHMSLSDLSTRLEIWTMGIHGFKERPFLGWGQSNFNYVFNTYYDPSLWAQESWFDRVHNIVMDWLIAAGLVGALLYFAVLGVSLFYLVIMPLIRKDRDLFSLEERAVILGLLAAYTVHNFFVFDNVVSYLFYATILAFIHQRVTAERQPLIRADIDTRVIENVAVPVVGVLMIASLYLVNVPNIQAARDIIRAFSTNDANAMMTSFEAALARNSFGDQEIREQMTRKVQELIRVEGVPELVKQNAFKRVEEELLKQAEEKPNDARVHVFISSFYRLTRNIDHAVEQLAIARSLSPQKQQIIFEQGLAQTQKGDEEAALAFFKEAYDLDPTFYEAKALYAVGAINARRNDIVESLIVTDDDVRLIASNDLAIETAYQRKNFDLLKRMFEIRVKDNPEDQQLRTSLAVIYHESGDTGKAIEILQKAAEDIPTFKEQAEQFMTQLLSGQVPAPTVEVAPATGPKRP